MSTNIYLVVHIPFFPNCLHFVYIFHIFLSLSRQSVIFLTEFLIRRRSKSSRTVRNRKNASAVWITRLRLLVHSLALPPFVCMWKYTKSIVWVKMLAFHIEPNAFTTTIKRFACTHRVAVEENVDVLSPIRMYIRFGTLFFFLSSSSLRVLGCVYRMRYPFANIGC